MKKFYMLAGCFFVGFVIFGLFVWPGNSPLKNNLYLKYELSKQGVEDKGYSDYVFTLSGRGYFLARMNTEGLFRQKIEDRVDRSFISPEGMILSGPIGGLIWINPQEMKNKETVPGGKVIAREEWQGYDVYVVEYPELENCRGYYDKTSGLQVGFSNHWSIEKLDAVLVDTNAQIARTE
ncbi:MAG: hypothetical protein ABII88_06010 [Candidatus Omnitrophota bacterium]